MSMTWKQFKEDLESQGVADDMFIDNISFDSRIHIHSFKRPKPQASIFTVGYAKHVDVR